MSINFGISKFTALARDMPEELLELVRRNELRTSDLTWAAEALGEITGDHRPGAVQALLDLSANDSPLVREGAVYGMSSFMDEPIIAARLRMMEQIDTSPGVREAARETFEDDEGPL
jgi:hypothetical protein